MDGKQWLALLIAGMVTIVALNVASDRHNEWKIAENNRHLEAMAEPSACPLGPEEAGHE